MIRERLDADMLWLVVYSADKAMRRKRSRLLTAEAADDVTWLVSVVLGE